MGKFSFFEVFEVWLASPLASLAVMMMLSFLTAIKKPNLTHRSYKNSMSLTLSWITEAMFWSLPLVFKDSALALAIFLAMPKSVVFSQLTRLFSFAGLAKFTAVALTSVVFAL